MKIKLKKISIDGGTQPREDINEEIVSEYAEAMKEGDTFPPIVVFNDGAKYWLADGFHRYHASNKIGYLDIEAEVKQGTKRDAVLYSVSANSKHGLRRTNADKRKAVLTLLNDEEWSEWSNSEIARKCSVSEGLVRKMVSELETTSNYTKSDKRRGADGRTINTSNIGTSNPSKLPERFDRETGEILDDGTITEDDKEWVKRTRERKGIGLEKAHEAISKLKQIPPNDGLLEEAYETVIQWINDNK